MKERALVTFFVLFVCFVAFEFAKGYFHEKTERDRITQSFNASGQSLKYYVAQNGKLAAQNQTLQLRYNEVKQIFPKVLDEIHNLDIKPSRVTQYAETVVKQEKEIQTKIRDSLICDTIKARVFSYRDSFYSVSGIAVGDSQKVHITSIDSIVQVVYKSNRIHPWLWFFSPRKLSQVITSKNPNSRILYQRTIQIVKR